MVEPLQPIPPHWPQAPLCAAAEPARTTSEARILVPFMVGEIA